MLFYRDILFPAKARIDLSYYPERTIASDIVWMIRSLLAVLRPVPSVKASEMGTLRPEAGPLGRRRKS